MAWYSLDWASRTISKPEFYGLKMIWEAQSKLSRVILDSNNEMLRNFLKNRLRKSWQGNLTWQKFQAEIVNFHFYNECKVIKSVPGCHRESAALLEMW